MYSHGDFKPSLILDLPPAECKKLIPYFSKVSTQQFGEQVSSDHWTIREESYVVNTYEPIYIEVKPGKAAYIAMNFDSEEDMFRLSVIQCPSYLPLEQLGSHFFNQVIPTEVMHLYVAINVSTYQRTGVIDWIHQQIRFLYLQEPLVQIFDQDARELKIWASSEPMLLFTTS